MQLSVVSTLYQSARYLREFHNRVSEAARLFAGEDYELVLVNDGSPDDSLQLALELQTQDSHIRIVDLSRNFGHHAAMWTGLHESRGDWVFLIDSDLEESPEWLPRFQDEQQSSGADVIYGVMERRGGGLVRNWGGRLFYLLFNALSDEAVPVNIMTVRLMSRRYVNALLQHSEVCFIIGGLWSRTGFQQIGISLPKQYRPSTSYALGRRVQVFVDALTSFSSKPLSLIFWVGLAICCVSLLVAASLCVRRLFLGELLAGWASLMVTIWFLGGLSIFCQGIIGVYLARVYLETKRRPIAIIRQIHKCSADGVDDSKAA